MKSCCMECVPPRRHPGCHDKCKEYQEWKAEHLRIKGIEDAERSKIRELTEYDIERNDRVRKYVGNT